MIDKPNGMPNCIPISQPALVGNERKYVLDCLDSSWISSNGAYIAAFEQAFAAFCGTAFAVACCNGTVALHLALAALGIGRGDEVIVPSLTFVATANAVRYTGATPIFVDIDAASWVMAPEAIRHAVTPRTRAIIPVHLFGHPAPMDAIQQIAGEFGLAVVEDAAEAHGASWDGRMAGGLGDIATFSFYGNKILTTGEGGMLTTNSAALADKIRLLRGQGQDPQRRYWFIELGYNYRMTNIAAAIGLGQLENVEWHLRRRREIAADYQAQFHDRMPSLILQGEHPKARHAHWLTSVVLPDDFPLSRDQTIDALAAQGIETRPFFYPLHQLPAYAADNAGLDLPVTTSIAARGISLPTYAAMTDSDIRTVIDALVALGQG
jgi:perosamine synthetase